MEKNTILKKPIGLNPYTIEGESNTLLKNIVVYNDNGILVETDQGWFLQSRLNNNYHESLKVPEVVRVKKNGIEKAKQQHKCFYVIDKEVFTNTTLYLYAPSVGYEPIYMGINSNYTENVILQYKLNKIVDAKFYIVIGLTYKKSDTAWRNVTGIAKRLGNLSYSNKNIEHIQELYIKLGEAIENAKDTEKHIQQVIHECLRGKSLPDDFITATCRDKKTNEEIYKTNAVLYNSIKI